MGARALVASVCAPNLGALMSKQLRTTRHRALMAALVAARHSAGLSQRELAKRLDRAHSFVGKIESGERQLNVLEFCEYVDALAGDGPDIIRTVMKAKG
jgi:ribosome-binding protein aMBF1 (putative translation factor)